MTLRRAWRWSWRVGVSLLALIVAAAGVLLLVLHTDWGRERLRRRAVAALHETFPGCVRIGKLEGSVLGDLVLRDVELCDASGRTAITVERLGVNLGVLALLRHEIEVESLTADGVRVAAVLRAGRPANLATVVKLSEEPSTWDIALRDLRVRDLDVTIDRDGMIEHLDDLTIDATADVGAVDGIAAQVVLAGTARERAARFTLDAEALIGDGGVIVPWARITAGQAVVETGTLVYRAPATESGSGLIRAGLVARFPDGELARLTPELHLPPSALDAWAVADLTTRPDAPGLRAVSGTIAVGGRGKVADFVLDQLGAGVRVEGGVATVDARARGPGQTVVTAGGEVTIDAEATLIRNARLQASVASIKAATMGKLDADGALEIALDGSARLGARTTLTVNADVVGRGLRSGELRAGDVTLHVAASGEPRALIGEAKVETHRVLMGKDLMPDVSVRVRGGVSGPLAIDLDARDQRWAARGRIAADVALGPPGDGPLLATITLGAYRFDLPRASIEGTGGRITVEDERTIVSGVRMHGAGAILAIDGVAGRGRRAGQVDGTVDLTRFDLARLRDVPGLPRKLAGAVAVHAKLRQRGTMVTGKVDATADGLVIRDGASPIDLKVGAEIAPRRVKLGLNVSGHALGSLAAIADVVPPRQLTDVAAWKRLNRSAINVLDVRARDLDLARLSEAAGTDPSVEGTLDAVVGIDAHRGIVEIRGHGLVVAGAPAPLDLDLDLTDPHAVKVAANGTLRELGTFTLTTSLGLPARPFDPAAWSTTDLRSLQGIDLVVHEIDLDASRARRLGIEGVTGKIAATIHAAPGLGAVEIHVAGRDVIAGPLLNPIAIGVDTTIDRAGTRAKLQISLDSAAVITGDVDVPVGLDRVLAGGLDLETLPINAKLSIADAPVASFTRALGQDGNLGGQVHGDIELTGTVAVPTAKVALVVNDLGGRVDRRGTSKGPTARASMPTGGPRDDVAGEGRAVIRELTIAATYRDGAVHGDIRGHANDGGQLAIVADIDPAAPRAARASLTATKFQLAPLARLAPTLLLGIRGVLDADLQLTGIDPSKGRISGVARISGGQAPLANAIGNLRDATAELSFHGSDLKLTMSGAVESGRIEATGTAKLVGLLPDSAVLDITANNIDIIAAAAPHVHGSVHVEVVRDADRWRATAHVHHAAITVPEKAGRVLHPASLPTDIVFVSDLRPGLKVPPTRATMLGSWLGVTPTRPVIDVTVQISPVAVVSEQLRGDLGGRLHLAIGTDGASIDGRVGVIRGNVSLFERRYGVRRADLVFDGSLDPLMDVQLEYEFPTLTMKINLGGRLSKPELHLSSDPNTYAEGQLLAIMLGGPPGTPGNENSQFVTGVAAAAASQLVGGFVAKQLPIRVDVINYEPVTSDSSGAFVVGRWLTKTTLLLLRTRIDPRPDENLNEAEIERWLNARLLLETVAGDRGVLGADLLWNKRW